MNLRIKQLAEQATTVIEATEYSGEGWIFNKEKFAELIVRECAKIIETQDVDPSFKNRMSWAIKKHFGVEEPKGWICPKCNADRTKIACPLGFGATVDGRCPMTVEAQ